MTDIGLPVQLDGRLARSPTTARRNVGWDFASWLAGLHPVNELVDGIEELLLGPGRRPGV